MNENLKKSVILMGFSVFALIIWLSIGGSTEGLLILPNDENAMINDLAILSFVVEHQLLRGLIPIYHKEKEQ